MLSSFRLSKLSLSDKTIRAFVFFFLFDNDHIFPRAEWWLSSSWSWVSSMMRFRKKERRAREKVSVCIDGAEIRPRERRMALQHGGAGATVSSLRRCVLLFSFFVSFFFSSFSSSPRSLCRLPLCALKKEQGARKTFAHLPFF